MTWPQPLAMSLVVLWAAHGSAAGEPCSPTSVLTQLRAGQFVRIDRMRDFPSDLLAEFWRVIPGYAPPQSFAEPGEDFQVTDVISKRRLPWRRLIFGGRSPSVTFIYYEKGGRGLSRHLFVKCSQGASARSFSYLRPPQAEDVPSLLGGLAETCLVEPPREYLESADPDRCL